MKNKLIDLVKETLMYSEKLTILEDICELCETFRFCNTLDELIQSLYEWLHIKYNISKMTFATHDLEKNINCIIFTKGEQFSLDDPHSRYFIINTNTEVNAIITVCADDQLHFNEIDKNRKYLEILFFQIAPIIENAILRRLYIDQASIDSVTNVYNKKYLLEHIHKKIKLADDEEDIITFMIIGIDRFKAVIDEFDYDIGDKVLVELAKVIRGNIKSQDIVARLIGDEFLVAILHTNNMDQIQIQAKKIIDKFADVEVVVNEQTQQTLRKTICIGISSYPKDGNTIDDAIKNADKFLEEARNKGRGSFAVYEKEHESPIDLF